MGRSGQTHCPCSKLGRGVGYWELALSALGTYWSRSGAGVVLRLGFFGPVTNPGGASVIS